MQQKKEQYNESSEFFQLFERLRELFKARTRKNPENTTEIEAMLKNVDPNNAINLRFLRIGPNYKNNIMKALWKLYDTKIKSDSEILQEMISISKKLEYEVPENHNPTKNLQALNHSIADYYDYISKKQEKEGKKDAKKEQEREERKETLLQMGKDVEEMREIVSSSSPEAHKETLLHDAKKNLYKHYAQLQRLIENRTKGFGRMVKDFFSAKLATKPKECMYKEDEYIETLKANAVLKDIIDENVTYPAPQKK